MTIELKNKIKNELHKAFIHCGETDPEFLNEKVENELETMACFMAGSYPEVIHTDKGDLSGYTIDIVVAEGNAPDEIVALRMVVSQDAISYVINSFTATKPEGWKPGDRKLFTNEINRLVKLEDVDPDMFN